MANAETRSKRVSFIGIAAPWCCKARHSPSALPSHLDHRHPSHAAARSRRHADRRRGFHQGSAPSDRHNRNARTIAAAPSVPDNRSRCDPPPARTEVHRQKCPHRRAKAAARPSQPSLCQASADRAGDEKRQKRPAQPSGAAGDSKGWRSTWRTAQHATSGQAKKSIGQKASAPIPKFTSPQRRLRACFRQAAAIP